MSNSHIIEDILALCHERNVKLAFAESLTGGLLSAEVVAVAGASKVFLGSVIAYNSELKVSLLGVPEQLLADRGAVDPEVSARMALGVQRRFSHDLGLTAQQVVAVSTTGVAGPEVQDGKPVGLVYLSIAAETVQTFELNLQGERNSIREQTVDIALLKLREHLVI